MWVIPCYSRIRPVGFLKGPCWPYSGPPWAIYWSQSHVVRLDILLHCIALETLMKLNKMCRVWRKAHQSNFLSSLSAATVVRDASGNVNDSLALKNFTTQCSGLGCKLGWNFDRCEQNRTCSHGLANNLRVSASALLINQYNSRLHLFPLCFISFTEDIGMHCKLMHFNFASNI